MNWLNSEMLVLDAARAVVTFAANWLLQSTLLIVAGMAVARLLRRRGAALQSAIYRTTLAAVLVCPLATSLLGLSGVSGWSVGLPVAWTYEEKSPPLVPAAQGLVVAATGPQASEPLSAGFDGAMRAGRDQRVERSPVHQPGVRRQASGVRNQAPDAGSDASPLGGPALASSLVPPDAQSHTVRMPTFIFQVFAFGFVAIAIALAWLLGTALLVARLTFAWIRLRRLLRAAAPAEAAVQEACRQAASLVGVAAPKVLSSPYLASPCLAGWPRAAIVLPDVGPALPLRDVLIHELAHLRRGDAGWNLVARLTEALFFYQPLLWLLTRRLEASAEDVCDDYVVEFGGDRSQYARGLLEIAELATTPVGAPAVAMVSLRSILARRVTRIMDSSRSLSTRAGNLLLALVIAGGLTGATIVGFVGLAPHPAADAEPMPDAAKELAATADDKKLQPSTPVANTKAKTTSKEIARAPAADSSDIDDILTVSGKVVDPQGKPFAGAKLYAVRWYWEPHVPRPPLAETTSEADGRFAISYRKSQFTVDVRRAEPWKEVSIVATADGFGTAWVTWNDIPRGTEPTLRLVADDVPIAGRIVDLEGKPVAGITVRVGSIHTGKGGNLDGWLAAIRRGEFSWTAAQQHLDSDALPQFDRWPPRVVTGRDGRFRFTGLGRERLVELSLSSPKIAYQEIEVVTRRSDIFPLTLSRDARGWGLVGMVYAAEFGLVAPPTQPITGIVRDAKTRQPLAGVSVESNIFAGGNNSINTRQLRAVSDEQGRYRLAGMPKGTGNHILAVPNDDQPYLMRDVEVPEARGLEPVEVDIELHRGIWITGRVTDQRSGEPVLAWLHYHPFWSNEYAQKTPEFGKPRTPDGYDTRYASRPDGSYRLVGLPGRAVVGAESILGRYRAGVGAESIAGMNKYGHFDAYPNPVPPGKKWPHAMKEINPSPGTEEVACDLALDPGEKLTVNVLDPDGKPLDGFEAEGSGVAWTGLHSSHDLHGTFEVITLGPDETRTVIILHKERKLGKVIRVRLAEHPSGSLSVTVEPTATMIGRLVDRQGAPISGAAITASALPTEGFGESLPSIATDAEGRFEYTHVPIGCHYDLNATAAGLKPLGPFAKEVAFEPGETKDLGDVIYGGDKRASGDADKKAASTKSGKESDDRPATPVDRAQGTSASSGVHRLRGRVVDDKGQPVVDAHVRMYRNYWLSTGGAAGVAPESQWLADTHSDPNGRFSAEFKPLSVAAEAQAKGRGFSESIGVFATAEGFGFGLRHAEPTDKEVELRLVRDSSPVEGRLLDLEGRPVRGAQVTVRAVAILDDEPRCIDDWLDEVRESGAGKHDPSEIPNDAMIVEFDSFLDPFPKATTGDDGKFRIAGIGADRVAYLEVEGPKIASTWLPVVTRPIETLPLPTGLRRFATQTCYGSHCDIVAVPEQPIRGLVRDAQTGQPVEGAEVRFDWNDNGFSETGLAAKTDAEGRYQLSGLPKPSGDEQDEELRRRHVVELRVIPAAGQPYFRTEVRVPRGKGLDAVICDVPLRRAVTMRGQITDRKTGQPVRAAVRYYPFLTNDEARRYSNFEAGVQKIGDDDRYATDDEGRFIIPALPGRGVLTVAAERGDRYSLADGAEAIADFMLAGQRRPNVYHLAGLNQDNAVREVGIPADAQQFSLDVRLAPLPVTRLLLVDEEDNELSGVETQGLAPMNPFAGHWSNTWREPLATASAELIGPEAGETRETLFLDRAHSLGAMVRVTPDDIGLQKTKRIVLHPCGSVRGRVVDGNGQPVAGAWVDGEVVARESRSPAELRIDRFTWRLTLNLVQADAEGRFELKGVPPGARYAIEAFAEKRSEKWRAVTAEIESGATVELGDVAPQADAKQQSAAEARRGAPENSQLSNSKTLSDSPAGAESRPNRAGSAKDVSSTQPAKEKTLRGRVLASDGQPFAGAAVLVRSAIYDSDDPPLESATTDAAGRFDLSFRWPEFDERIGAKPDLLVVAAADGRAPDWKYLSKDEPLPDMTLTLNDEKPIEGRIVNAEGRPLAGVNLRVQTILHYDADAMKLVLDDFANDRQEILRKSKFWRYGRLADLPARVTTGADGRFRVRGIASNTVIILHARGGGIRDTWFRATAATRDTIRAPVPPAATPYGPRAGAVLYGSEFDYIAEPGRRVQGMVRDGETRLPVAKAKVVVYQPTTLGGRGLDVLPAESDAAGRFVLDGCAKDEHLTLHVEPPVGEAAYFPWSLDIADKAGLGPIEQDVELVKGIELRGRIIDSQTGVPLVADVSYEPIYLNKYVAALYERRTNPNSSATSKPDGSFRIAVVPGPGAVAVSMPKEANDYTTVRVSYDDLVKLFEASASHRELAHSPELKEGFPDALPTQQDNGWSLLIQTNGARVMLICPEEHEPLGPLEVKLVRGRSLAGRVLDPAGQPLVGVTAFLVNPGWAWQDLESADFTVTALAAGEKREISFYHAARKLGAFREVTTADTAPLVVRLEKCVAAVGRVLDEDGAPRAGMQVWFSPANSPFSLPRRFAVTDADGRFRTDELIPGGQYELMRSSPNGALGHLQLTRDKLVFSVASAQVHDLGDLVVKGPVQTVSRKRRTAPVVDDSPPAEQQKAERFPGWRGKSRIPSTTERDH